MLVSIAPRTVDPVLQRQATVRAIALAVSETVVSMFDQGRWSDAWPLAGEIHQVVALIQVLDAEIGDVCVRAKAERNVEAMARSAHEIVIQARLACAAGAAALSPCDDLVLLDLHAEALLIGAYSLVAF